MMTKTTRTQLREAFSTLGFAPIVADALWDWHKETEQTPGLILLNLLTVRYHRERNSRAQNDLYDLARQLLRCPRVKEATHAQ